METAHTSKQLFILPYLWGGQTVTVLHLPSDEAISVWPNAHMGPNLQNIVKQY